MPPGPLPRRRVLAGLAGGLAGAAVVAGAAGCTSPPPKPKPDPLAPVLTGTLALRAAYDATIRQHADLANTLTPLRADHDAHVRALTQAIRAALPTDRPTPSASPTPTPTVPPVPASASEAQAALATAEQQAQQVAAQACLTAPADRARLLGSITACRATHRTVLAG